MTMKLYFMELSAPCRAVNMVAQELGISLEIVPINLLEGEHLLPEFLKVNPAHTVPALDDNGFIVFDSHAICSYLINKYGKDDSLYPKDPVKRAKVDEQLFYNTEIFCVFKAITGPILIEKNPKVSDAHKAKLIDTLNILETILEKQDYTAGDQLTIADICHIAIVPTFKVYVPVLAETYPRLTAWQGRCIKQINNYNELNVKGTQIITDLINEVLVSGASCCKRPSQ